MLSPLPRVNSDSDALARMMPPAARSERREQLIVGVAASVPAIYRYFAAERKLEVQKLSSVKTFRRDAPKVGRNERCPCGSGKKFKHCCANATLH